eukprot:354389-Chlamydomonas_euryale.AAC.2
MGGWRGERLARVQKIAAWVGGVERGLQELKSLRHGWVAWREACKGAKVCGMGGWRGEKLTRVEKGGAGEEAGAAYWQQRPLVSC